MQFFGGLLHIFHSTAVEVFTGQVEVLLGERRHGPLFEICVFLAADLLHPLGELLADLVRGKPVMPGQFQNDGRQIRLPALWSFDLLGRLVGGASDEFLDPLRGPEGLGAHGHGPDLDDLVRAPGDALPTEQRGNDHQVFAVDRQFHLLARLDGRGQVDAEVALIDRDVRIVTVDGDLDAEQRVPAELIRDRLDLDQPAAQ